MSKRLAVLAVFFFTIGGSIAEARPAHRPDDIAVTTTLAQRLAARAVLNGVVVTDGGIEEARNLAALVDDLDFAGSASFLEHLGAAKIKAFTLDGAPKMPQTVRLSRSEAKTLVKCLVPGPKAPWDASFARLLVALSDDATDALDKSAPKAADPVAKK